MELLPRSQASQLETVLAATPEQIHEVFAMRAAVYMSEQHCPYDEEFDGNDFAGSHILGLVDGEPAAVLRIRYFAQLAKLERWTVLPRFRKTGIGRLVVERAIEHCRRKGYRKMYGHSQARLVDKWRAFGFRPMAKNNSLVYSDHTYVEMIGEFAPHSEALTPLSDPLMLIRPEGQWDIPGVLDHSGQRPATNPH
jgi:predicted GNAT family N-acyltransferase